MAGGLRLDGRDARAVELLQAVEEEAGTGRRRARVAQKRRRAIGRRRAVVAWIGVGPSASRA
jgi:hypothetical protein